MEISGPSPVCECSPFVMDTYRIASDCRYIFKMCSTTGINDEMDVHRIDLGTRSSEIFYNAKEPNNEFQISNPHEAIIYNDKIHIFLGSRENINNQYNYGFSVSIIYSFFYFHHNRRIAAESPPIWPTNRLPEFFFQNVIRIPSRF